MQSQPEKIEALDRYCGLRIRSRRREVGLSQEELAKAIGVTFQQVQKYERGANRISYSRLVRVSQALQVSPAFFFEGIDAVEAAEGANAKPDTTAFFLSVEGQDIAQLAMGLAPAQRRALVQVARSIAAAA